MAMSKSISKKILLFLLMAVTTLSFAVFNLSFKSARADGGGGEPNVVIDASTDRSVVENRIADIQEQISDYEIVFDSIAEQTGDAVKIDVDKLDQLDFISDMVLEYFDAGYYQTVTDYLYGDVGLNGLLGIYHVAYEFYNGHVAIAEGETLTSVSKENGLVVSVDKKLIAKSTEAINAYSASDFCPSTEGADGYQSALAREWLVETSKTILDEAKNLQADLETVKSDSEKELDYLHAYYFSEKFGLAYANETVYESSEDVSEVKLNEVKAKIATAFNEETVYETAITSIQAEVTAYKALFTDMQTALSRVYDSIHAKSNLNAEDAGATADLIDECEIAFKSFENLGTVAGYIKGTDGEFHEVEIDLKSGNPVGQENDSLGDLRVALNLMNDYKALVKRAINESESILEASYGVSSEKLASAYVNYAKGLADCLNGYFGKLTPAGESAPESGTGYRANQYSYVNADGETVEVVYGSDIVKAFLASPFCDGALVITENGETKRSVKLDEFLLKSTVIDDESSKDYTVTLTCIDEDGNEVKIFNSDAKLLARAGATPSIERNLFLILRGDKLEEGTQGLDDATREYLNGRVLSHYFTFIISSSVIKDGKLSVLEFDKPLTVLITIKFNKAEDFTAIKDKTCALSYCHTNVNAVYSDIEWGDSTMTLKVSNFVNQAQIAFATKGDSPLDIPTLIVYGLVAFIAALLLIWVLVKVIKFVVRRIRNRKFKIVFNARGGKFNSCLKVRLHEKFNHPAPPVRKGYKFLGWFEDSKCTVRFAMSELSRKGNMKVYAKWISDEEYEALNEKYDISLVASNVAPVILGAPAGAVVVDPNAPARKDVEIEKIEAEKLSYEAKKAEEERKTEEVKLQAIREIDEAKKNDEARAKAEQDASDAKAELEKTLAEREELIRTERADERAKCIEEMQAMPVVSDADYQAAIAKAKAETEEKLRKEFDEESKARAEEQAKINEELSNKIKALEEATAKAEADAKAKDAENARLAEEEAKRIADNEAKINAAIAAGIAAKLAEVEAQKVEEPVQEEPAQEEPVVEETAPAFDTEHVFDVLKAEIYSFADADDLGYGLEASVPACAMKVVGDTIELEVNLDLDDCAKKGYKVVAGDKLPVKFVLSSDDDIDEANELIEETMFVNGLKKTHKAVLTAATAQTREQGFEHGLSKDKVADTPEEFYKLLRVYAKSFVLADDGDVAEKPLIKMFLRRGRVYLYLNHEAEGLKVCDADMAALGFKAFMTVKSVDDCKQAVALITAMMKANGLVRFPVETKIADEDCAKGFTYTLSK